MATLNQSLRAGEHPVAAKGNPMARLEPGWTLAFVGVSVKRFQNRDASPACWPPVAPSEAWLKMKIISPTAHRRPAEVGAESNTSDYQGLDAPRTRAGFACPRVPSSRVRTADRMILRVESCDA